MAGAKPPFEELYRECGTDFDLSLDVKDAAAAPAVLAVARAAGDDALRRLWLCHHNWQQVAEWRSLDPDVRLVIQTDELLLNGVSAKDATLDVQAGGNGLDVDLFGAAVTRCAPS